MDMNIILDCSSSNGLLRLTPKESYSAYYKNVQKVGFFYLNGDILVPVSHNYGKTEFYSSLCPKTPPHQV